MIYWLKHFDTPVLKFEAEAEGNAIRCHILWVNEPNRSKMPLDLQPTDDGLVHWLCHRTIPKNRAFVHSLLAKSGIHANRPLEIIQFCKGLSLNDCYWVIPDGYEGIFANHNLYDNRFSQILAQIAFTGFGSSIRSSAISSPEFTTNGMLPKCWRRIRGHVVLFKGGTTGAANCGMEPYSEYYASQIAQVMGIHAIPYGLSRWKGILCSTCELFTSKKYSFLPIGRMVRQGGFGAVYQFYQSLGQHYIDRLADMVVYDAIICNTDRHFGNFGFLVDNEKNEICTPAPLFDHGNALFNFAYGSDWDNMDNLNQYIKTLQPCVYDDFIQTARDMMTARHRAMIRHLLSYRLKKHPRYNLPDNRLNLISKAIQERARELM